MSEEKHDVIIVGGGHAGCEAALAAARMGARTLLVTISLDSVAVLPKEPGFNSLALLREVDALGGETARVADETRTHKREEEKREKHSVMASICLVDRRQYFLKMKHLLESQSNLTLRQDLVTALWFRSNKATGVLTKLNQVHQAKSVVLAVGTFLRGKMQLGQWRSEAGHYGELAATELVESLKGAGLKLKRSRMLVAPRFIKRTLNFKQLEERRPSLNPVPVSFRAKTKPAQQVSYYLARLDKKNPGGQDTIFLLPDGTETEEVYASGLETGLTAEEQTKLVQATPGLEQAKIVRLGYAIEYDYIVPDQLRPTLEAKAIGGLFSAGQINGTSGYEEAAAQGIIAGINAALKAKNKPPLIIDRTQGYIGVLIDDLVTKEADKAGKKVAPERRHKLLPQTIECYQKLGKTGVALGLINQKQLREISTRSFT